MSRFWRLAALLGAVGLSGCVGVPPTSIEVTDGGVLLPTLRASVELGPRQAPPAEAQNGLAVELGLAHADGDGVQALASGQRSIEFAGRSFVAPQTLRHEYDFALYDAALRWRQFFPPGGNGALEAFLGVGYSELDFAISSAAQRASESMSSWGLVGGIGALWRMRPGTSLQARLTGFGSANTHGVTSASRLELFAAQALGRNVALRAGYALWSVEAEQREGASSIEIRFSGPTLGLSVHF